MKTYRVIVSGKVQGVGFRAYVSQAAQKEQLKGTVRNLSDGTVEIILQGSEEDLQTLTHILRNPQHAFMKVADVRTQEVTPETNHQSFTIIY